MPNRQVYIPDELVETWEKIPNKSAFVQEATERWLAMHIPNTKTVAVVHFEAHFEIVADKLIINIPEETKMAQVQQTYHPHRDRDDYFLRELNLCHDTVKTQIERTKTLDLIDWNNIA